MCMLVGMLFTRTLGQLGEVGSKAVSCGKLVKLSWGKIRQGALLVVMKLVVKVFGADCAGNAIKGLGEKEDEVIQASFGKKVKKD